MLDTVQIPSGASVCGHMKLSLSCSPTCSCLSLLLKPDLATDLWLFATISSITLLTCV